MLWAPNYCEPSRPEGQDVEAPGSAVAGPATVPAPPQVSSDPVS